MKNLIEWLLKIFAKWTISKYKPTVIGITGSVGKTSAKEAIYAVLKTAKKVRASRGNFNSPIGLPLTILGEWNEKDRNLFSRKYGPGENKFKKAFFLGKVIVASFFRIILGLRASYPEVLVLEYGADRPGDIKYLLEIARPQIAVITAVGKVPVHVEHYSGPEDVLREKGRLVNNLGASGFAVLNADDELVMTLKEKTRGQAVSYGFKRGADLRIINFENRIENGRPVGVSFKLEHKGSMVPVKIDGCLGVQTAYAVAAAASVGIILGMNLVRVAEASALYDPPSHRMRILSGIKQSVIIDDSYNASPLSMSAAIETVKSLPAKRKVGILGDMLELGAYSVKMHEEAGITAASVFDFLVTIGPHGKLIAGSSEKNGLDRKKILKFDDADEGITAIENLIKPGDLVLIKASRGIKLDKIAEALTMAHSSSG